MRMSDTIQYDTNGNIIEVIIGTMEDEYATDGFICSLVTTRHPASSYNIPVYVHFDGNVYGPKDVVMSDRDSDTHTDQYVRAADIVHKYLCDVTWKDDERPIFDFVNSFLKHIADVPHGDWDICYARNRYERGDKIAKNTKTPFD